MEQDEGLAAAEMAALDENCAYFGLVPLQLMENAGARLAAEIQNRLAGRARPGRVTILAGTGNNGGDAFVAARHLQGHEVTVLLLGHARDIRTEESRRNWELLQGSGQQLEEITDSTELRARAELLAASDVVVDAIFGTGVKGAIREPEATAIELLNRAKPRAQVVAVDIPSGLDPDTGEAVTAVRADLTVTFHRAKRGLLVERSAAYVGELVVAGIGIPSWLERLAGPGDVRMVVKRSADSHKGDNGRILIVGGGPFVGAPTLTALAALRAGADWVTVAAPRSVSAIIASYSPNLIVHPLSSTVLVKDDVPAIVDLVRKHDVVVIGMGLGAAEATKLAAQAIIEHEASRKVVVDADGFYGLQLPLASANKRVIVTPHAGEFAKLVTGVNGWLEPVPPEHDREARVRFVQDFARRNGVVTLLKGPTDFISDGTRVKLNRTGNAGMTVGGTGDVLAGLVGAFFAVHDDAFKAATAAAFVNGAAGDLAFVEKGYSLLATDVLEKIPAILRAYT
jgi:hydroxyethylthiazole kinase-like uncharacterized protein yjeF